MEAFEKEQAAARAAWYEDAAQREGELRLANTLRHGWRAVAVRVADLGGLKVDADDALDETAEVEAFERARPPKPRVRGKRTLDARFRDADQARYRDAPRVLVAAEDRGDAWAKTERDMRVARGTRPTTTSPRTGRRTTARTAPGGAPPRRVIPRGARGSSGRRRNGR